jgi:hypothetical protein
VQWRLEGHALVRTERLTASRPVRIVKWSVILPSTGGELTTTGTPRERVDVIGGREGTLRAAVTRSDWPYTITAQATGDSPLGRGARGAIPLHLRIEARDIALTPGTPAGWTLRLQRP